MGLPAELFSEETDIPAAEMVVGNPPCSRFSHLSLSFFGKDSHEDVNTFPEIIDLVDLAKRSGAGIIWWETGPLAWSLGRPLVKNLHHLLIEIWGEVTTLIIRVDLRYLGIPQRRPRVHLIHLRGRYQPPALPAANWPTGKTAREWINQKTKDFPLNNPLGPKDAVDPLAWAREKERTMTFRSMVPRIYRQDATYTHAVISRRCLLWEEDNRFFDLLEYAALMTYPLNKVLNLLDTGITPAQAQVLLSKSVAPKITAWITNNIITPLLRDTEDHHPEGKVPFISKASNFWEVDLTTPIGG